MQTRLHSMRYDTGRGAFEARVDLERDGRTLRYPVRLEAPETAPRDAVEAALTRQALRMSQADRPRPSEPSALGRVLADAAAWAQNAFGTRSGIPVRAAEPHRPRARLH